MELTSLNCLINQLENGSGLSTAGLKEIDFQTGAKKNDRFGPMQHPTRSLSVRGLDMEIQIAINKNKIQSGEKAKSVEGKRFIGKSWSEGKRKKNFFIKKSKEKKKSYQDSLLSLSLKIRKFSSSLMTTALEYVLEELRV